MAKGKSRKDARIPEEVPHPEGCECGECDAGTSRRSRSVIRAELEQLIRIHVRPEWQEWLLGQRREVRRGEQMELFK